MKDARKFLKIGLCAILFSLAFPSYAIPIVHTTLASFEAAVGGAGNIVTEDFEGSPLGSLAVGTTDIGLFSITINNNDEGQVAISDSGSINGSREFHGDIDADATTILNFSAFSPTPLLGFAGTWGSTTTGDLLTMIINATTFNFDDFLAGSGNGFLGFTDVAAFSSVSFGTENPSSAGEFFQLDNALLAGSTSSIPEPTTLALLSLGLAGFGFTRRKMKT